MSKTNILELTVADLPETSTAKTLARLCLDAMAAREDSFNKDAAEAARKASVERVEDYKRKTPPSKQSYSRLCPYVDYENFYRLTYLQAAKTVCEDVDPDLTLPVYLLIIQAWNDVSEWATRILAP